MIPESTRSFPCVILASDESPEAIRKRELKKDACTGNFSITEDAEARFKNIMESQLRLGRDSFKLSEILHRISQISQHAISRMEIFGSAVEYLLDYKKDFSRQLFPNIHFSEKGYLANDIDLGIHIPDADSSSRQKIFTDLFQIPALTPKICKSVRYWNQTDPKARNQFLIFTLKGKFPVDILLIQKMALPAIFSINRGRISFYPFIQEGKGIAFEPADQMGMETVTHWNTKELIPENLSITDEFVWAKTAYLQSLGFYISPHDMNELVLKALDMKNHRSERARTLSELISHIVKKPLVKGPLKLIYFYHILRSLQGNVDFQPYVKTLEFPDISGIGPAHQFLQWLIFAMYNDFSLKFHQLIKSASMAFLAQPGIPGIQFLWHNDEIRMTLSIEGREYFLFVPYDPFILGDFDRKLFQVFSLDPKKDAHDLMANKAFFKMEEHKKNGDIDKAEELYYLLQKTRPNDIRLKKCALWLASIGHLSSTIPLEKDAIDEDTLLQLMKSDPLSLGRKMISFNLDLPLWKTFLVFQYASGCKDAFLYYQGSAESFYWEIAKLNPEVLYEFYKENPFPIPLNEISRHSAPVLKEHLKVYFLKASDSNFASHADHFVKSKPEWDRVVLEICLRLIGEGREVDYDHPLLSSLGRHSAKEAVDYLSQSLYPTPLNVMQRLIAPIEGIDDVPESARSQSFYEAMFIKLLKKDSFSESEDSLFVDQFLKFLNPEKAWVYPYIQAWCKKAAPASLYNLLVNAPKIKSERGRRLFSFIYLISGYKDSKIPFKPQCKNDILEAAGFLLDQACESSLCRLFSLMQKHPLPTFFLPALSHMEGLILAARHPKKLLELFCKCISTKEQFLSAFDKLVSFYSGSFSKHVKTRIAFLTADIMIQNEKYYDGELFKKHFLQFAMILKYEMIADIEFGELHDLVFSVKKVFFFENRYAELYTQKLMPIVIQLERWSRS